MGEGGYKQINKSLNICAFEDYLESQQRNLPKLYDVEQISPRVIRVLGQNPGKFTLQGTNTYIIGTGERRLIVDTAQGYREWADLVDSTLQSSCSKLSAVLLTHWHGDHTGGVPDLLERHPDLSDAIYKNLPESGQREILPGQVFRVEGATVRAVHTPGHSDDHMCFILDEDNAMFTGDNILGHGSSAVEDLSIYMKTLDTMKSYNCAIGYPAHGAVIQNLPLKIKLEISQKLRREKQTLAALHRFRTDLTNGRGTIGSVTLKQLVTAMYGDGMNDDVRSLALEPFVDEILRKLARDDKVAFEMRGGVRKWFALETE